MRALPHACMQAMLALDDDDNDSELPVESSWWSWRPSVIMPEDSWCVRPSHAAMHGRRETQHVSHALAGGLLRPLHWRDSF